MDGDFFLNGCHEAVGVPYRDPVVKCGVQRGSIEATSHLILGVTSARSVEVCHS